MIPSTQPSVLPSSAPTTVPSSLPSDDPSMLPSISPSSSPSDDPSMIPSISPSSSPSDDPSMIPSTQPSVLPSSAPTTAPSSLPSDDPSMIPSASPSSSPSDDPSMIPSASPSSSPSDDPSMIPTTQPSVLPSSAATTVPSLLPSSFPTTAPSTVLADKFEWYITPLNNGAIYGQSEFRMEYNISNRDYVFDVFEEDCTTKVEDALGETESVKILGDGFLNVTASLALNLEDIENNSGIWTSSITGGQIKFCVGMSLFLKQDVLMNFYETTYTINVDKTSGFELADIAVERTGVQDGGSKLIDYEEMITAFHCHDDYSVMSPLPILSQGDVLQVCVQVENSNSIFEVEYVRDMNVTQPDNDDSPVMVVSNRNNFAYDALTLIECNEGNNQICRVKFQLLASFFEKSNPPDLSVSGTVKMKVKTTQARHLSAGIGLVHDEYDISGKRKLEGDELLGFTLDVELSNALDSASFESMRVKQNGYAILAMTGIVAHGFW